MNTEVAPPPRETLYVNNLNERVKITDLKEKLHKLFSQHGNILEVVAKKTLRKKGQAFIVFDSVDSATKAKDALHDVLFEGKPLRIQFARSKSDAIAKIDGSYDEQRKKRQRTVEMRNEMLKEEREKKRRKKERRKQQLALPPNNILFVESISPQLQDNQTELINFKQLFQRFDGCKDVRYIPQKNVAFVEYESIEQSTVVLKEMNGVRFLNQFLVVSFARIYGGN